jgi:hypothetical protein
MYNPYKEKESANLRQGQLFNKHLQKTREKTKVQNGLQDVYPIKGADADRYASLYHFKEGFETLDSRSKKAVDDTNSLLARSNDEIQTQLQQVAAQQKQFDTLMTQYERVNNLRVNTAKMYVNQSNSDSTKKNKNVFVSSLVNNPKTSYVGCYLDKPQSTSVKMIPVLSSSNMNNGNADPTFLSTRYVIYSSSVYQNNQNGYNVAGAFDQDPNTWWHSNDSNIYNDSTGEYIGSVTMDYTDIDGSTKTAKGEYIWVKLPGSSQQIATNYSIMPREGFETNRSPNTWIVLGGQSDSTTNWSEVGKNWVCIDQQSGQTFHSKQSNNYTISNPGPYNYYCILVTKVGNDDVNSNRISLQMSIDYFMNTDALMTDDKRAMIYDTSYPYLTYDQCRQKAADDGYRYFGMQDVKDDGTAACLVSNDLFRVKSYGRGDVIYVPHLLWSSNTGNNPGSKAKLEQDGRLTVTNTDGKIIFQTPANSDCVVTYTSTPKMNAPGNDYTMFTGKTPETCQAECDAIDGCYGIALNNGNCWPKYKFENWYDDSGTTMYQRTTPGDAALCKFYCILQGDGNLCIYKGADPSAQNESVWCSMTNGKQQDANSNWLAKNGSTGTSYFTVGTILYPGQWVGSDDGTLQLIMQPDGNLVLFGCTISNQCTQQQDRTYGLGWTNAVYENEPVGNTNVIGKMGYIDESNTLYEYPSELMKRKKTDHFIKLAEHDSVGNDITYMTNTTPSDCQEACNNEPNCFGYEFDNAGNRCWLKDKNMYPVGDKKYTPGYDLYYSSMQPDPNDTCTKDVMAIDSVEWGSYYHSGQKMSKERTCGLSKAMASENYELAQIETQLGAVAQALVDNINSLETLNSDMFQQMGIDKTVLNENLVTYKKIASQYGQGGQADLTNVNGILSDTMTRTLQENYGYIFWCILAIIIIVITIRFFHMQ